MTLADEKQGFSRRLHDSLRRVAVDVRNATAVAREFNLRYEGAPVTAQATRKWLEGRALPSQDKIRALALWLDVSPQWLRFGEPESRSSRSPVPLRQDAASYRVDHSWPGKKFELLSDSHKRMVIELVIALLRLEGKQ